MMSSILASISFSVIPCIKAFKRILARPVNFGRIPAPIAIIEVDPLIVICPLVGWVNPATISSKVDLPDPLVPITPMVSPACASKDTPLTAQKLGIPLPQNLKTAFTLSDCRSAKSNRFVT